MATPTPDDLPEPLRSLTLEVDRRQREFDALWPVVLEARRLHFVERTEDTEAAFEAAAEQASEAKGQLDAALAALFEAAGVDPDDLAETVVEPIGDPFPRISRASVINDAPVAEALVDDFLPGAVEMIERHAPSEWLAQEPPELFRLSSEPDDQPMSIVKGVRLESERPRGHRLRQTISLAKDYLANDVRYDHFAGALALTQLAQLGAKAEALAAVGGSQERIDALFSAQATDAIIFELLVAAACGAKGRNMVFVEPSSVKSPDLRCNDPFKMVVECKRSSALSHYEVGEEARMRVIFAHLYLAATQRGQFGLFEIELTIEAGRIDLQEVVAKCILQRLAAHPGRALEYSWGSVAFHELPRQFALGETTKAYSPYMLDRLFRWDIEMPLWDGLICKIDTPAAAVIDQVRSPIGLAWRVVADAAIIKRSRAPIGLFSKAVTQIPRGEFGLVYLAYTEGGRSDVADNRTQAFMERIRDWEHDAGVRIPAAFLVRQYPFPTGHGNPDVVESTVKLLNHEGRGDDWIFREYPAAIFTTRE